MSVLFAEPAVSRDEAARLVSSVKWFHRVEPIEGMIAPGYVPPQGSYDAAGYADSLQLGDIRGKRILEIGTWDGPMAYELAKRGADVVASDIQDPKHTGFNVLGKIGGFKVPYVRTSVYDLHKHFKPATFDIVLFLGVFYHLKHPLMAFEKIASVLKLGGQIRCEGAGIGPYFENLSSEPVLLPAHVFETLNAMDEAGVPLALSYPGTFRKGENWFLPNKTALKGWMQAAGFDVDGVWMMLTDEARGVVRLGGRATKVGRPTEEHKIV
jgi:tRNA (mo5U34)-methyltransferase